MITIAAALTWLRGAASWLIRVTIPVPLAAVLALGLWWSIDRTSYARRAVAEAVAGAEIDAERARTRAAELVQAEITRQRDRLAAASASLESDIDRMRSAQSDAEREIRELQARPVSGSCTVDRGVLERLRSR